MRNYKYVARDVVGGRKEGLTQAVSSNDVLSWLREQGYTPISVNEIMAGGEKIQVRTQRRRIKCKRNSIYFK